MQVANVAVDADILVNNGGTSISRATRNAAFCKPLYKFSDNYIPRIRRIGGCYGFTSKPPAARRPPPAALRPPPATRHPPPAARRPPPAMVLTR